MAAIIGNRNISLGVMGGTLITAACYGGGNVFGCSPYDAATTAYLKATYPAYWAQISDYGFANPQLVPWINEDNDLIVSLVSVGKERWLVGDGVARFDTGIIANHDTGVHTIVKQTQDIMNGYVFCAGRRVDRFAVYNQSNQIIYWYAPDSYASTGVNFSDIRDITYNVNGQFFIKDKNGNTLFSRTLNQGTASTSYQSGSANVDYSYNTGKNNFKIFDVIGLNGALFQGVPVRHNGECGMLDIVNATFHGNIAGSGSFTIEMTDTPT